MYIRPIPLYYKYLLTFIFIIEEINKDQTILPNVTLGYHIYDSCAQEKKAVKSVLQILSGSGKPIPNFSCMGRRMLSGFIGDQSSITTVSMAQILAVYGYTQISYGATSYLLSDRNLYPTFYRTVQGDRASYSVLSSLIKFFGWTWVGVLASDDDSGNEEIQLLTEHLTSKRICVAYTIILKYYKLDVLYEMNKKRADIIRKSSAQVIILCGTYSSYLDELLADLRGVINDKTLVFGPTFALVQFLLEHYMDVFNGSLALQPSYLPMLDMSSFYDHFQTINYPEDKLLEHIMLFWFNCLSRDRKINNLYSETYKISLLNCSGKEPITEFDSFHSPGLTDRVYKAVYSMAYALHNMHMSLGGQSPPKKPPSYGYRHWVLVTAKSCHSQGRKPPNKERNGWPETLKTTSQQETTQDQCHQTRNPSEFDFLDITIKIIDGQFTTGLFRKPMDKNTLLLSSSFHPQPMKRDLPFSQHLKAAQITFDRSKLPGALDTIGMKFVGQGYDLKEEQGANQEYLSLNSEDLMSPKTKTDDSTRITLHRYVRDERRVDGDLVFNKNGDFVTPYKIVNWLAFKNGSLFVVHVGRTRNVDDNHQIYIQPNKIVWKNGINEIMKSQCSENCQPGTRKVLKSDVYSCCYSCVQCSEGEISNVIDSENCLKCADHEWPNEKKTQCVPKELEFLSYTNDTIVDLFLLASFLLCFLTSLILRIFILHRDTPLVKANNKNLSFLLLVSIMLSILSVFLFLGHPVDATCMLRQISFGILFSGAISCVLGKTIMVYIVFKASKPQSPWKCWISTKLSNCVVFVCSSIQVVICMSWVTVSPPFQELDTHSYQGRIIVQCNEGSLIGFYSVLGYMGILAAISFITAFLARTLPDSFNEAKYITFSMLVFCSVWITMIPAYLSSKGKYMVAVEIFAILASCAGLLGCIFFPKCYIILWRPELNTRKHLLEKGNDHMCYS
ncbi:uncharacterized protein LOC134910764 [Pseudophryne corroboree]|uniref:uncharacterized protein LOC134910764 n=1 Tax=Pseudophryne corroboree TaxID=495146 RepID=UPI003081E58C